jgi:hypothetical protein
LFVLVGIAGENDRDAPDLEPISGHDRRPRRGNGRMDTKRFNLAAQTPLAWPQSPPPDNSNNSKAKVLAAAGLDIAASAHFRDLILGESNAAFRAKLLSFCHPSC